MGKLLKQSFDNLERRYEDSFATTSTTTNKKSPFEGLSNLKPPVSGFADAEEGLCVPPQGCGSMTGSSMT